MIPIKINKELLVKLKCDDCMVPLPTYFVQGENAKLTRFGMLLSFSSKNYSKHFFRSSKMQHYSILNWNFETQANTPSFKMLNAVIQFTYIFLFLHFSCPLQHASSGSVEQNLKISLYLYLLHSLLCEKLLRNWTFYTKTLGV